MEEDIKEIVLQISAYILKLAGFGDFLEENKKKILENIENGKAYAKFLELVKKQGGDVDYLNNIPRAKFIVEVKSEEEGFVGMLDAEKIRKSIIKSWSSEELQKKIKLIV